MYVFGFGGHARSVGDIAIAVGFTRLIFVDAAVREGESFGQFPAIATLPDELGEGWVGFPAVGDGNRRRMLYDSVSLLQPALIAPTASVGQFAEVADAVLIAQQAHVGPLVRLECGVIVNSGAVVDHETRVGAFSHIAVNATVAGRCDIGEGVFIGAGATVIDGIRIVDGVTVGAGATVIGDLVEPGVYVGTPARLVRR